MGTQNAFRLDHVVNDQILKDSFGKILLLEIRIRFAWRSQKR